MANRDSYDRDSENLGRLARLDDLRDFKVAEGDPDVRGWDVVGSDGRKLGEVKHLIADPAAMRVRYLEVELDRSVREGGDRRVLLPIGTARLDDARDEVIVDSIAGVDAGTLPTYAEGADITRDYESTLRGRFTSGARPADTSVDDVRAAGSGVGGLAGGTGRRDRDEDDFYAADLYDESRFRRRGDSLGDRNEARLTRSEEELAIGRRQVEAGEVGVRKTVETERVEERVPVTREEVTVERRPLSADAGQDVTITDDEIRIPVMEEQLLVEKRIVPKEEIVIRKRAVTEEKTVEADLRRERVEYDDDQVRARTDREVRGADRTVDQEDRGGNRLTDAVDDLKDRVDGNPASRPGPDATDRPERRL
jgi:uncharacterized protein (TIGR02271 family)